LRTVFAPNAFLTPRSVSAAPLSARNELGSTAGDIGVTAALGRRGANAAASRGPTLAAGLCAISVNPISRLAGVTLPPTFKLGDQDKAKYEAIDEADNFVLKFRKPVP
jgi:hypothetical protein